MKASSGNYCRIEMFGGLRVIWNDQVLAHFQAQKPGALLAYLAYYSHRSHAREELMELLWPEVEPSAGRNRLKQTLSVLRAELENAGLPAGRLIEADRAFIRLEPDAVSTDVVVFEKTCRSGSLASNGERAALLDTAIQLYRGGLLPGFYEDWVAFERERLASVYEETLLTLVSALEAQGDIPNAIEYARRAVAADPLQEEAHTALMRLYAAQGQRAKAVRQYREMEHSLREDLGENPSLMAQALLLTIQESRVIKAVPISSDPQRPSPVVSARLEPVGGAIPLSSQFYIVRSTDREFAEALTRQDSIVMVKGPRQIGKTSLLARGLQQAREAGARVVLTDLQQLTAEQLQSANSLFRTLADSLIEELELDMTLRDVWDEERGWNVNFDRFLRREVLARAETPLVWGLDEVDRLFSYDYGSEVFALFRYWHNLRALRPSGPWLRLTLAMAYATEAHLFITDLNQSPFNVGTRLALADFTLEQVADLNNRYGSPLTDKSQVSRFFALLGGNPYLVRRGLHEMVTQHLDLSALEATAQRDDGPFHDHLHRIRLLIIQDEPLVEAVREVRRRQSCADTQSFYRLRSAGVLAGELSSSHFRCRLYADFLERAFA